MAEGDLVSATLRVAVPKEDGEGERVPEGIRSS